MKIGCYECKSGGDQLDALKYGFSHNLKSSHFATVIVGRILKKAAHITAATGDNTFVETTVAIEFAAS